ncbi:DUF2306 domain-containing protein [Sphingobium nicotianae]|uniref:DUF2306 domain-containing protein n=1 Tax=Sphingobium nicotianae TaxID=2782607 RepID=A0A9X1AI40_9SPHN|nr:hypothetical protein [Sphingobium nicotianae]MBT2185562.1 hypothetical protein [Sphingobium nicotianae]
MTNALQGPDRYEKLLSGGAVLLLTAVIAAILRGHADWPRIPASIWAHLATMLIALVLTPVMLLRRRGDARHRMLGWIWCISLVGTALISFDIRVTNHGGFSIIHLLSIWTLVMVPRIVWAARTHRQTAHRRAVRGMVTGALLIAGFFTFPFNRLLGHWLFG